MAHNGNATDEEGGRVLPVPGILAMADCSEPNSENQALVDLAVGCVAAMGTDVTILDLRDLELPEYSEVADPGDLPQGAHAFRQLLCAHDGFLVASPSELGEEAPLLMNAIAWSVCPAFGDEALVAYTGKCASLMSATGKSDHLDTLLAALRDALTRLGVLVLPDVLVIPASDALATVDPVRAADVAARLELQMRNLVGTIRWAQGHAAADA